MLAPLLALALASAPKIVVVPVASGAEVPPQAAAAFTNALVGELRRQQPAVEIITQRDIEGLLSVERTKQFLGCSTDACMAELGGALGADRLVIGDVARLGESLLVHLRLLDSARIRVAREADRRFKRGTFDDALDALPAMVAELFASPPATPAATVPAPASARKGPAVAPGASWRTLPPMPTARSGMGLAVVGGRLYAIGGWTSGRPVAAVEELDPRAGTWRARAPMPTPRTEAGLAVLDGRIFAVGGWDGSSFCDQVEEYDPAADRWTKRSPLPQPLSSSAVVAAAGRVFALGGNGGAGGHLMEVYAYEPSADRWTRRSSMPVGRAYFAAAAVGDQIYAIGGDAPAGARVDAYDVAADRWTTRFRPRTRLPEAGWWMAAAVANDRIFVLGGKGGADPHARIPGRDTALAFDPATDRWTELPRLPWPRYLLGAAVLGNDLVAVGGAGPEGEVGTAATLPLGP